MFQLSKQTFLVSFVSVKAISKIQFLLIGILLMTFGSCRKDKCPDPSPAITYLGESHSFSSLTVTIAFSDCDGDLGTWISSGSGDESMDLHLKYFELDDNGDWITPVVPYDEVDAGGNPLPAPPGYDSIPLDTVSFTMPDLSASKGNKGLEGDTGEGQRDLFYSLGLETKFKYEIALIDQAGNRSNTVVTSEMIPSEE